MVRHVWYAAYGSNVSRRRFLTYLTGGRPPGAGRPMRGARDPSAPIAQAPCSLPHRLRFGGESKVWGGGVAYIDPERSDRDHSLGRRYLITVEQFNDVLAQESGRPLGDTVDIEPALQAQDGVTVAEGKYDHVVPLGHAEDHPVLTFTMPTHARPAHNPPSPSYAATIADGVAEAHGLEPDAALHYVRLRSMEAPLRVRRVLR